jgi:tetratricopeptide (TPR) repeat protein
MKTGRIGGAYGQIKWVWEWLPQAEVLRFIGALRVYQEWQGLWADSLEWANVGLEHVRADENREAEETLLNNIGTVYDSLDQREQALDFFNRALPIQKEVGDRYCEGITHYNLAMTYRDQGQLVEAVAELEWVVEVD